MLAQADVAQQNPSTRLPGATSGQGLLPWPHPTPGLLPVSPGGRGDRPIGLQPRAAKPKPGLPLPPEPGQWRPTARADPLRSPQPGSGLAGIDAPTPLPMRARTSMLEWMLAARPAELTDGAARSAQATTEPPPRQEPPPPQSRGSRRRLAEVQQSGKSPPSRTDRREPVSAAHQCRAHLGSAVGSTGQDRHRVHAAAT